MLFRSGFVVTWDDYSHGVGGATGDDSGFALKAQVFAANGAKIGPELLVNTTTLDNQDHSQITALPNGGFAVVWHDDSSGGATDRGPAVKAQVFNVDTPNIIGTGRGDLIDATHTVRGQPLPTEKADYISGRHGDDVIHSLGGNDVINGGAGADAMYGGAGDDRYYVDNPNDVVHEAPNEGTDKVFARVSYALAAGSEVEYLIARTNDDITLTGNELANHLTGGAGHDLLEGGAGNDVLVAGGGVTEMIGGAGDDLYIVNNSADKVTELPGGGTDSVETSVDYALAAGSEVETLRAHESGAAGLHLVGNELANRITGGAGNDIIDGGGGADILIGGGGNDRFVFTNLSDMEAASAPYDRILDFSAGDRIDLTGLEADAGFAFSFIGSTAFTGHAGDVRQFTAGGDTFVAGDLNGDNRPDFAIVLIGAHTLHASDFVL